MIGAALAAQAEALAAAPVLRTLPGGWRNSVMPPERAGYRHGPDSVTVSYQRGRDGRFAVTVSGVPADEPGAGAPPQAPAPDEASSLVEVLSVAGGWIEFADGDRRHRLHVFRHGDRVWVQGAGR